MVPFTETGRVDRWLDIWLKPAVAAMLSAAAVYGLAALPLRRERAALRRENAEQAQRIRVLGSAVERGTEMIRLVGSEAVAVAPLYGAEPHPKAWGRIAWDRAGGLLYVYAAELDPALPGRSYAVWLVTEDRSRIRLGSLQPDPGGTGFLVAPVTRPTGRTLVAEVTDEPALGGPQPTGTVWLAGTLP